MDEYCKDCIDCEESWSAGSKTSCHDACEKYQNWKAEKEDKD